MDLLSLILLKIYKNLIFVFPIFLHNRKTLQITKKIMAAYSIVTPNLISSNPKFLSLTFHSKSVLNNLSFCVSNASFRSLSLRNLKSLKFVRRVVSVTSEYEQSEEEEEVLSEGEEVVSSGGAEEVNLSEDLKIFVGNLPFGVDSSELAGLFGSVGTVEMVEVIYDKVTGRSRGFGFVTMSSVDDVKAVVQQFNGYELQGRALRVNSGPPPPKEDRAPRGGGVSFDSGNRLYVGNLSWGVETSDLQTLFSEHGQVTDAKVVVDRDSGRSRGFGFVTYSTAEEANNAISSLNGYDLDGRTIRVSVAEARPPRQY